MRMPGEVGLVVRISGRNTELSSIKPLGESFGCVALDASQPGKRFEGVAREPGSLCLARETVNQDVALALELGAGQSEEDVGNAKVAIELRDLVLQDQVVPERIP